MLNNNLALLLLLTFIFYASNALSQSAERHWWSHNPAYEITAITGEIRVKEFQNNGAEFQIYHEREIYMDNGDVAEIIMAFQNGSNPRAWLSFLDDGVWRDESSCTGGKSLENLIYNDRLFYTFRIYPAYNLVYFRLANERTGEVESFFCSDNSIANSIDWINGSAEFYPGNNICNGFTGNANIFTDWAWDTNSGSYVRPGVAFSASSIDPNQANVDAQTRSTTSNGRHKSVLSAFYDPASCSTGCGTACSECVTGIRTDILPAFASWGWDTACANRPAILNEWCNIDPNGCNNVMRNSCGGVCDGACGNACTQCVLQNRTDILPAFSSWGWNTACPNRNAVVNEWCNIDSAGCQSVKNNSCASVCN